MSSCATVVWVCGRPRSRCVSVGLLEWGEGERKRMEVERFFFVCVCLFVSDASAAVKVEF